MRLLRFTILLFLATILIAEPVVHSHPLTGSDGAGLASPAACALCAAGPQQITVVRINIAAPAVAEDIFLVSAPLRESLNDPRPLASRAPPAA
jgi:hypothetical protein